MNVYEKIKSELESPEGQERIKIWAEEYAEKEKIKNEKIKQLMSNTDYINWLNKFTQDKQGFCDDDWVYFPESLSDFDRENVDKLNLFYKGIDKYSNENHIYPDSGDFESFYRIKLNEMCFEIGIQVGQGTRFFCTKTTFDNENKFIDFNDIMCQKKQANVDKINSILDTLASMVVNAYENGVPLESMVIKIDKTLRELGSRQEDRPKTLQKK